METLQYILTDEDLKKLHKIELELLDEVNRICRKNDIPYSIDGGTLLGAVRHDGFIPWDDDADVIMNRNAYVRFVNALKSELNQDKFYFQDMDNTPGYRWGYGKLRRKETEFIRLNQEYMPYDQGVFLDIFVCDNVPDNYLLRSICNFHSFLYRKAFYSEVGKNTAKGLSRMVYKVLNLIPEEALKRSYSKYINFRNRKYTIWVKCLTFPACNHSYGYKREWYEDVVDIEFENHVFWASRKKEEYLEFLYGNYMQLPPIEKRKVHPVSKIKLL